MIFTIYGRWKESFSNILGVKQYIYKIERITKDILFFIVGGKELLVFNVV